MRSALHRCCARLRATRASATGCIGRRGWPRCNDRGRWRGFGSQPSSEFEVERGGAAPLGVGEGILGGGVEVVVAQAAMGEAMGLVSMSGKVLGSLEEVYVWSVWREGASGACLEGVRPESCLLGVCGAPEK